MRKVGLVLIFALSCLVLSVYWVASYSRLNDVKDAINLVASRYFGDVSTGDLVEGALHGVASTLDGYSMYFSKEEYRGVLSRMNGEYVGIGLILGEINGFVQVIDVIKGSPAAAAGVSKGDIICSVNGIDVYFKEDTWSHVMDRSLGSKLDIVVMRGNEKLLLNLERKLININSVELDDLGNGGFLIKINFFNERTAAQLAELWRTAVGMEAVLLDLRNNPGGVFDQVLEVARAFLDDAEIVTVSATGGKYGARRNVQTYKSQRATLDGRIPMIVLINGATVSGAEVLAGALASNKRALLVGERSFGKGRVQEFFRLPGGGALKLTTGELIMPSGISIDKNGVTPIEVVAGEDQQLKVATEFLSDVIDGLSA